MEQGTSSTIGEVEGWAEHVQLALNLIREFPLGILVLAALAFGIYQTRRIKELYRDKELLTREMFRAKSTGYDFSDEAEETIVGFDRRKGRSKTGHKRRMGE